MITYGEAFDRVITPANHAESVHLLSCVSHPLGDRGGCRRTLLSVVVGGRHELVHLIFVETSEVRCSEVVGGRVCWVLAAEGACRKTIRDAIGDRHRELDHLEQMSGRVSGDLQLVEQVAPKYARAQFDVEIVASSC